MYDGAGAESAAKKLSATDVESERCVYFMHIRSGLCARPAPDLLKAADRMYPKQNGRSFVGQ